MHADLQDRLKLARDELREFLESLHRQDEPGRFAIASAGLTDAGARVSLVPSCLALRTARTLDLWSRVDRGDRAAWLDRIRGFQHAGPLDGEPACDGAFLDPVALEHWRRSSGGRLRRAARSVGVGRRTALRGLARGSTRVAIGTLLAIDALPGAPYRALPDSPRALGAALQRLSWRDPAAGAAELSHLCMLVATQTPHFLELTEIRALKSACARRIEALADPETGGYFRGSTPRYGPLLTSAARVLEALAWLDEPPQHPERLIDTCLAGRPAIDGGHARIDDWTRVLHHCARHTSYRRSDIRECVPDVLELTLAHRQTDGGWSDRPGVSRRLDGYVEVTRGMPVSDLYGTARMTDASAMLADLLGWESSGWSVLPF